ncbi:hypothetical protein MTR67_038324 [Solanum verrucosum]|uniref:Uncharacterized protein n=1 Tax=Solanum verrucosum TaxID=315347 RepID=A0AAF0UGM9_SOLVR|nr:hypothetical protein MTR67_038324 [Solanum verrucosum]
MKEDIGDWKLEFARLCDYADMIKQINPGSSCWVKIDKKTELGKNHFVYFYVCFHAFKQGWLEACRNIIGFDGCFLKGVCKDEQLVVVGKNGNNQMYLIASAVVDTGKKHNWSWFIRYLIVDLNLGTGEGLTLMSAIRKGLIPVLLELLLNAEKKDVRTQSSQQSLVTTVVSRTTQTGSTMGGPSHSSFRTTYATTQSSQPSSICVDTTSVPRPPQKRVQVGTGRGLGRKKANARGTTFVTERDNSSSQLLPLSGHKRPYSSASFVAATGGNRSLATDFGVYFDPTTGAQIFNLGTSSEKILHGPTKLKSASPTNIDIDFKPHGLKWKGKDAVSTSQLQQMKANRKKKRSCGTSKK